MMFALLMRLQGWNHKRRVRRSDQRGAALVEFAIAASLIIVIIIQTYDFGGYYRLAERSKHAVQIIHAIVSNDADHNLSIADLSKQRDYLTAVTQLKNLSASDRLIVMDVMPLHFNSGGTWQFIVCWSWSSDSNSNPPYKSGTSLSLNEFRLDTWIPVSGLTANAALLIVQSKLSNERMMVPSLVPDTVTQTVIGPVRFASGAPMNLMLYDKVNGTLLNESLVKDPNASNAILCKR